MGRRSGGLAVVAAALTLGGTAAAAVPTPRVGPPLGTTGVKLHHPQAGVTFDLARFGYREDEYLVSGTATNADGSAPAPYSARIIVRRPTDSKRFNGTVLQEWFNVSLAHDVDVDWINTFPELTREGYAYVGVSAQPGDIPLQQWDPVRYSGLDQPGDGYADEIFAQVGQLLHAPAAKKLLGRRARYVIGTGMSQSAERLHSYINAGTDARDKVFDGFLIDRGVDGVGVPPFKADPRVPTIFTLSENEAEPDQAHHGRLARVWQIDGASHIDEWLDSYDGRNLVRDETGTEPAPWDERAAGQWGEYGEGSGQCGLARGQGLGSDEFPARYARDAALFELNRWIRTGTPAAQPPLMKFNADGSLIARDADGNALGGLRLPQMVVPVAGYDGENCPALQGKTTSFSDAELFRRYPAFADYSDKLLAATRAGVAAGIVRPCDAVDIMTRVARAAVRWPAGARGAARPSPFTCTPAAVCTPRTVTVRLAHRFARGRVLVRGRRVRALHRGTRRLRLRLQRDTTVVIRGRTPGGRRVVERHRYRLCAR
jgi:hypothetical protein